MKKFMSFILCLSIIFSVKINVQANSEISATDFFNQIREMANTYDNSDGLASDDSDLLYTYRLIVKTETNEPLNDYYGAIAVVEGYDCLHFLQYKNRIQAENAYIKFKFANVKYVEYDFYITLSENTLSNNVDIINEHLSWNSASSQVDDAFRYILENNIDCHEVRVAVIDSGLYAGHDYFSNSTLQRIYSDYFYSVTYTSEDDNTDYIVNYSSMEDDYYHGTHVAGTIFDNSLENVKIVPYRVTNERGILYSDILSAFESILIKNGIVIPEEDSLINSDPNDDIDIVNMSFGGDLELLDTDGKTLYDKISLATNNGIIIVAAAGNEGNNANTFFPACHPMVISVSATDENNMPAGFSNLGSSVDISAPGANIRSTTPRTFNDDFINGPCEAYSTYMTLNGTSYATPLVAAAVAMVKSINPDITPAEVERIIKETAYIPKGWDTDYGSGILNFYNLAKNLCEPERSAQPIVKLNSDFEVEATLPEGVEGNIYCLPGQNLTIDNYQHYTGPIPTTNPGSCISFVCHEKGKLISDPVVFWIKQYINLTVERFRTECPLSGGENMNITWRSFDPDIAKVDQNGNITGVSVGETQVYATFDSGLRITYVVTVEPPWWQQLFRLLFFGFIWCRT